MLYFFIEYFLEKGKEKEEEMTGGPNAGQDETCGIWSPNGLRFLLKNRKRARSDP